MFQNSRHCRSYKAIQEFAIHGLLQVWRTSGDSFVFYFKTRLAQGIKNLKLGPSV